MLLVIINILNAAYDYFVQFSLLQCIIFSLTNHNTFLCHMVNYVLCLFCIRLPPNNGRDTEDRNVYFYPTPKIYFTAGFIMQ